MKNNMNPLAFAFALSLGAIAVTLPHQVSAHEQKNTIVNNGNDSLTFTKPSVTLIADKSERKLKIMEKLDLNESQKNRMEGIRSKYRSQVESLRSEIRNERKTLSNLMQRNTTESELRVQHDKIVELDRQMHNLRFEIMLEMREVLTTEQRQKWAESMAELRANRRGPFR